MLTYLLVNYDNLFELQGMWMCINREIHIFFIGLYGGILYSFAIFFGKNRLHFVLMMDTFI